MEQTALWINEVASWVKLTFEVSSILIVTLGGTATLWALVSSRSLRRWLSSMRPRFSRYLLVALELQLAADIIGTAISPSWEQLAKLAVIAVIRTFLSYFLLEETEVEETQERDRQQT